MLIAISGSQGSGKSTILEKIKEQDYPVVARKTSRSILTDWDVTLDDVNRDPELTIKFQEEITTRKWKDEVAAIASSEIWFTERTHMDLFTYAMIVLGRDNQYSDWLNDYYDQCYAHTLAYKQVFYLYAGCFEVEKDGVRGVNKHYSKMVDLIMTKHTAEATGDKLTVITECDLDCRVQQILSHF